MRREVARFLRNPGKVMRAWEAGACGQGSSSEWEEGSVGNEA
jgi:hypothetical protein